MGRREEGMHLAVDQSLASDLTGCVDASSGLQNPRGCFWNQVIQIDHHSAFPQESVRVEIGVEHKANNFPAVIDGLATWIDGDRKAGRRLEH